jgi:hypothetical protein
VSADIYSLTIIIFELFSGVDPFPGNFGQIFEAKRTDKKPAIPSDFPAELKELVIQGWSKEPKERPPLQEFKSALNNMLNVDEKQSIVNNNSTTLPETREAPKAPQEVPSPVLGDKKLSNRHNRRIVEKGNHIFSLPFNCDVTFKQPVL